MIDDGRHIVHGTNNTYTRHGCRCDPCREAHSIHHRQQHANGKGAERRARRAAIANNTAWMARGACAPPEHFNNEQRRRWNRVWFPIDDRAAIGGSTSYQYDKAREYCEQCPVRTDCLNYANNTREPNGMWGGHTPAERRQIRRAQRRKDVA